MQNSKNKTFSAKQYGYNCVQGYYKMNKNIIYLWKFKTTQTMY